MAKRKAPETRIRPVRAGMSTGRKILLVLGVLVVVVALVWGTAALTARSVAQDTGSEVAVPVTPGERGASGKTLAQDQDDALAAATAVLNAAGESPGKLAVEKRVTMLGKDDFSDVSTKLAALVRIPAPAPASLKANTYQSLVTLHAFTKAKQGKDVIAPLSADSAKLVFVDQAAGVAYVPLAAFLGSSASFHFEMQLIDGKWVLAPYSLVDSVRLLSSRGTVTASPSASAAKN